MASDWNESAERYKDFRHTHNGPEVNKKNKKKNTKKWCKGKVGVEHLPTIVQGRYLTKSVCKNCGKHLGILHYSWWT